MLRIIFAIFVLLLGGIVAAAYVLPGMIDWQKYKDPLLERLNAISPYSVNIDGEMSLQLLPEPFIAIGGVSFRDGQRDVLTVEQARLELALAPLFEQRIEVKTLSLQQPTVKMTDADVTILQTQFSAQETSQADQHKNAQPLPRFIQNIAILDFTIQNGSFSYKSADQEEPMSVMVDSSRFEMQSLQGPYKLNATLNAAYYGSIEIAATAQKMAEGVLPVSVRADIGKGQASIEYGGIIAPSDAQPERSILPFDLQGQIKTVIGQALSSFEQKIDLAGFLDVTGQTVSLDEAALSVGDKGPFALSLSADLERDVLSLTRLRSSDETGFSLQATGNLSGLNASSYDYMLNISQLQLGQFQEQVPQDYRKAVETLQSATVKGKASPDFETIDFILNAKILTGTLKAQGKLQAQELRSALIDFEAPNARAALNILPALEALQNGYITNTPLSLLADIKRLESGALEISKGQLRSGDLNAQFSVELPSDPKQSVNAEIALASLSLDKLDTPSNSANRVNNTQGPQFSRNAIDVAWLRELPPIDFIMNVDRLNVSPDMVLLNNTARIEGSKGRLVIKEGRSTLRDHNAQFTYDLDVRAGKTQRDPLSITGDIRVESLKLPYLLERVTSQAVRAVDGQGDLRLNFDATGISPAALVLDLKGQGQLDLSHLVLKGIDIEHFAKSLSEGGFAQLVEATLLQRSILQGQTSFQDVTLPFTIAEGYLTLPQTQFTNQSGQMRLQGGYDLSAGQAELQGAIQISREIRAPDGNLPSLPFTVKGPVKSLSFNLDTSAVDAALQRAIRARIDAQVQKQKKALAEKLQVKQAEIEERAKSFAPILNELLQKPVLPELEVQPVEPVVQPPEEPMNGDGVSE